MFAKKEALEKEIEKVEGEAISSIIDASMSITGEITFKGKTRIDGEINGNVTGEHLILSKEGKITGDVRVTSFICQGVFTGNIETKILTARKGSSINGKIKAGNLTVEPGASLDGEIKAATKDTNSTGFIKSTASTPPPGPPKSETKQDISIDKK
jgi:cytoskeletal protein CcmA (bactofilin family)